MVKMMKRTLLTYLIFFCIYFVVFMIKGRLITNGTWDEVFIITLIYSSYYLWALLIETRKHKKMIVGILLFLGILIILIPIKLGKITTGEVSANTVSDISFWINVIIMTIQIIVAQMQGKEYKEEKGIREEETKKIKKLFEKLKTDENVTKR